MIYIEIRNLTLDALMLVVASSSLLVLGRLSKAVIGRAEGSIRAGQGAGAL